MATNVDAIKNEILRYVSKKPEVLQAALLSKDVFLHQHAKTITKVKGEYPSIQGLMSHVVQSFYSKSFTPFGDTKFFKKTLRNYRQKIDFQFDPADVLGTVLEDMYEENKDRDQMSISKMAIDMLKAKIIDDVNILSIKGVYNPASVGNATPTFGTSMDGLNEIIADLKADVVNPVYSIPGSAITSANVLAQVTAFERGIPEAQKSNVKKIFMSVTDAEDYIIAYEDTFGQNKFQNNAATTRLGKREIVAVPNLTQGTLFATTPNNFLELVDIKENPAEISDVQVDKRIVNVLGEFTLGYDFAMNQAVYIHTTDGVKVLGLNNAEQNGLFYPSQF